MTLSPETDYPTWSPIEEPTLSPETVYPTWSQNEELTYKPTSSITPPATHLLPTMKPSSKSPTSPPMWLYYPVKFGSDTWCVFGDHNDATFLVSMPPASNETYKTKCECCSKDHHICIDSVKKECAPLVVTGTPTKSPALASMIPTTARPITTSKPTASPIAFTASPSKNAALVHKVRVQLEGRNILNMREVQVFDTSGFNHALNKPASQSSTAAGEEASKAVNGNLGDHSHTNNDAGIYHELTNSNLTVKAPYHSKRLTFSLTLILF